MAVFPVVNGNYYAFVDIQLRIQGLLFAGLKAVNYKDNLTRKKVRGTARVALGLTAGHYEANGDITMYLDAFTLLCSTLGPGWRQLPISMSISYGPNVGLSVPLVTDIIPAAYFGEVEASQGEGEDPLTRKYSLHIPGQILWNGVPSIIETSTLQAVA